MRTRGHDRHRRFGIEQRAGQFDIKRGLRDDDSYFGLEHEPVETVRESLATIELGNRDQASEVAKDQNHDAGDDDHDTAANDDNGAVDVSGTYVAAGLRIDDHDVYSSANDHHDDTAADDDYDGSANDDHDGSSARSEHGVSGRYA